jgi:hypothetical protein
MAVAADTRAAGGALGSRQIFSSVSSAAADFSRAMWITSKTAFGLPLGLPDFPFTNVTSEALFPSLRKTVLRVKLFYGDQD